MIVHKCARCDGSGHVAGRRGWEIPWTKWAGQAPAAVPALLQPRSCGDCGGTGALLEMEARPDAADRMPYRPFRGVDYQTHVSHVLARS